MGLLPILLALLLAPTTRGAPATTAAPVATSPAATFPAATSGPTPQSDPVYLCRISGGLTESTVALVLRTYRLAEDHGASHVFLEIDTPGGEITLMHRIIEVIESHTEIISVALVDSKAASAGALISIACDQLLMTPGSNIGSARPIWLDPFPLPIGDEKLQEQLKEQRTSEMEKVISDFRATFRSKAEAKGRNKYLAEAMVDDLVIVYRIEIDGVPRIVDDQLYRTLVQRHGERNVRMVDVLCPEGELLNLTAEEALEDEFIDAIVTDRAGAMALLDLGEAELIEIQPNWSERVATWVQSIWWILLIAAVICIVVEFNVPGFGVAGGLGIAFLALVLFGKYLAGLAEMTEILIIGVGFVLVAAELFLVPGMLVPGILGGIAILAGIVLTFQGMDLPTESAPSWARDEWWSNLRTLGLSLAAGIIGSFALSSILPRLPFAHRLMIRQAMPAAARAAAAIPDDIHRGWTPQPGDRGRAVSTLRPAGKIDLEGRVVDAVTDGSFVEVGGDIRVVQVEGNRIVVRSVSPEV